MLYSVIYAKVVRHIYDVTEKFLNRIRGARAIGQQQICIEFKKFTRSSNELTFNSSSKFPSLSFMNERKERNFELELKVSSFELLVNFLDFIQQLCPKHNVGR